MLKPLTEHGVTRSGKQPRGKHQSLRLGRELGRRFAKERGRVSTENQDFLAVEIAGGV